jgi:hypothetical protein
MPTLRLPACTAYAEPDTDTVRFSEDEGITGWRDPKTQIAFYGWLSKGELVFTLEAEDTDGTFVRVTVAGQKRTFSPFASGEGDVVTIPKAGYYRIGIEGVQKTGATYGKFRALILSGTATEGAHFNLKERRNAASVHLGYPIPDDRRVTAFYNEIVVKTDPLHSYYMACGFRRGYFGIQVNSATERRIIFSIWDAGDEAIDRNKVPDELQVKLLNKGENVVAHGFGNEGTGGHSHLVYPWKKGVAYKFLVLAKPQPPFTIYTASFWFPERGAWGLIASFRAPKDGSTLRGLYSFNENFWGTNGQLRRLAEFGPQWVREESGTWRELTTARFTHDPTGKEDRHDYGMGVSGKRFTLSNGGFVADGTKYGDTKTRPAAKKLPPELQKLPEGA